MNNVIPLKNHQQSHAIHAEATPDGINLTRRNEQGGVEHVALIPPADALKRLDAGEWDEDTRTGVNIVHALTSAGNAGYIQWDSHQALLIWRWFIAYLFLSEQKQANGTVTVEWRPGVWVTCPIYTGKYGSMNLHPASERLAMAGNIEGALIGRYGTEQGTLNAIMFYQDMRDENGLSVTGRSMLADLHDSFIKMMNTEGLPTEPTAH